MALFERGGLEQDTGLLKQRWAQDGSKLFNGDFGITSSDIVYTVTAGKILYIQTITIFNESANTLTYVFQDHWTTKYTGGMPNNSQFQTVRLFFDPPLEFKTNIDITRNYNINVTMTGWEEDAPN